MKLLDPAVSNVQGPTRADILAMLQRASDIDEVARWWLAPGRGLEFASEVTADNKPSGKLLMIFLEDGNTVGGSSIEIGELKRIYSDIPDPSRAYLQRKKNGKHPGMVFDDTFYQRLNKLWSRGPSSDYATYEYPFNNALKLALAHGSIVGGEARLEWKSQEEAEEEIGELYECDPESVRRTIHLSYSYFHPTEDRGWAGYVVTKVA